MKLIKISKKEAAYRKPAMKEKKLKLKVWTGGY